MASPSFGNVDFPSARTAINNIFQALDTSNAGASAPTDFEAFTLWLDTSGGTPEMKIRNAANSAWIPIDTYINDLQNRTDVSSFPWVLDEDDLASNSATRLATQQSIKAYIDDVNLLGWVQFNGNSGSVAISGEYFVTGNAWGITRNSTGNYDLTIPDAITSVDNASVSASSNVASTICSTNSTTIVRVLTQTSSGAATDTNRIFVQLWGTLA